MKRAFPLMAALAVVLGGMGPIKQAQAVPITYTEQGVATGSLGSQNYTNALVTVTFSGDTSNVFNSSGIYFNAVGTATVNVAGIGTATFTGPVDVFDNQSVGAAGITNNIDILDTKNAAFNSYALTTAIGPVSGGALFNPGAHFTTTAGNFIIDSVNGNSTFTATEGLSTTPEPSSLTLAGLFSLGLLGHRWRVRKKAVV